MVLVVACLPLRAAADPSAGAAAENLVGYPIARQKKPEGLKDGIEPEGYVSFAFDYTRRHSNCQQVGPTEQSPENTAEPAIPAAPDCRPADRDQYNRLRNIQVATPSVARPISAIGTYWSNNDEGGRPSSITPRTMTRK